MRIYEILEQAQPNFQKRLDTIFAKLLQADPNLMKFRMNFNVQIVNTHLGANSRPNFRTGGCNLTFDPKYSMYTDDALAWTLAHELAHCVLGHLHSFRRTEKIIGMTASQQMAWRRQNPFTSEKPKIDIKDVRNDEHEADVYAARLAVRAGFNPRNMLMGLPNAPITPADPDPIPTHGTRQQRQDHIQQQTGIKISSVDPETLQHVRNGLAGIKDPNQGNIFA